MPIDTPAMTRKGSEFAPPASLLTLPSFLMTASTLLQLAALFCHQRGLATVQGQPWFGALEMLLILVLLGNGWRLRQWSRGLPGPATPDAARHHYPPSGSSGHHDQPLGMGALSGGGVSRIATLCLASLAVCALGDLVNRNFPQTFFQHDTVIAHGYLADSVWFFLPGYVLFMVAAWRATPAVDARLKAFTVLLMAGLGLLSFLQMVLPGTGLYVRLLTGAYAMVITVMVAAGLWIGLAYRSRGGWLVAGGAVLASVADAVIGQFWLYGTGYYPQVAHLNWILYFISQALIQKLPVVVALSDHCSQARPSRS